MKRSQSARSPGRNRTDIDYQIKTTTGETAYAGTIDIKIQGESRSVTIPLIKTKNDQKPFQSKAVDDFLFTGSDVGAIKRITIQYNGTKDDKSWHLKHLQIKKGTEKYSFNTNLRLDYKQPRVVLHPNDQRKGDYVEAELRRLKECLRCQSAKLRRPQHKPHEPFVYNDLKPYFDTSGVDKAIEDPIDHAPGYFTRLTALRVVEPWEAYGMDYGVNYELLKQRRMRSLGTRRSLSSQSGMMILPPHTLPFGGQLTHVNRAKTDRSHTSYSSRRQSSSSSQKHNQQPQSTTVNA